MTNLEAFVAINMVGGVGSGRLAKLLEFFDKPQDILGAPVEKLVKISGISQKAAARLNSFKEEDLEKELKACSELGLKILALGQEGYPGNLSNIPAAPLVLYVKGDISLEDNSALSIVGSRKASFYGLSSAEKFAYELAEKGVTIVSGLARGVDSYVHRGALKAKGRTLAVIGSGFNHIYPQENEALVAEIVSCGAVISEFPLDTKPLKENFPRRNRIISGLSLGVLVVEAGKNSGAMITADFALEQNREVFALPGRIDSAQAFGPHKLIKQGAKLVTCVEDILEEFDFKVKPQEAEVTSLVEIPERIPEESVYSLINEQPLTFDELVEKSNIAIPEISDILLKLQLRKLVKQLPGKQFVRTQPF
jgi:DNA processing protein